jgi:hypothetical protein
VCAVRSSPCIWTRFEQCYFSSVIYRACSSVIADFSLSLVLGSSPGPFSWESYYRRSTVAVLLAVGSDLSSCHWSSVLCYVSSRAARFLLVVPESEVGRRRILSVVSRAHIFFLLLGVLGSHVCSSVLALSMQSGLHESRTCSRFSQAHSVLLGSGAHDWSYTWSCWVLRPVVLGFCLSLEGFISVPGACYSVSLWFPCFILAAPFCTPREQVPSFGSCCARGLVWVQHTSL